MEESQTVQEFMANDAFRETFVHLERDRLISTRTTNIWWASTGKNRPYKIITQAYPKPTFRFK